MRFARNTIGRRVGGTIAVTVGLVGGGLTTAAVASAAPTPVSTLFASSCPYSLQKGEVDGCVTRLQGLLNSKESAHLTVDGKFGDGTLAATKRWQTAHKLTADGLVGPATKSSLGDKKPAPAGGNQAVDTAARNLLAAYPGVGYQLGAGHGSSPGPTNNLIDCSGFTRWAFARAYGYDKLGNTASYVQAAQGTATSSPQPGDLVYFGFPGQRIEHIGIYDGSGQVISSTAGFISHSGIQRLPLSTMTHYWQHYGFRHIS